MGCLVSRRTYLEQLTGESLRLWPEVSNAMTSIYISNKRHVWKVCRGDSTSMREIFMNNYRVKRLPASPYIVQPNKLIKIDDESIAICMEHKPMDLYTFVQTPFELATAWNGLRDVAQGIAWMHAKGLAHRDVKPENICLDERVFCLIDFDFSTPLGDFRYCGTPNYVVPRDISCTWTCSDRQKSMRYDVYAFGKCVLYIFCSAATMGLVDHLDHVYGLYDAAHIPPDSVNPFDGVEREWMDVAVACCRREPPSVIPLTAPTLTAKDSAARVALPKMVHADQVVA